MADTRSHRNQTSESPVIDVAARMPAMGRPISLDLAIQAIPTLPTELTMLVRACYTYLAAYSHLSSIPAIGLVETSYTRSQPDG